MHNPVSKPCIESASILRRVERATCRVRIDRSASEGEGEVVSDLLTATHCHQLLPSVLSSTPAHCCNREIPDSTKSCCFGHHHVSRPHPSQERRLNKNLTVAAFIIFLPLTELQPLEFTDKKSCHSIASASQCRVLH